VLRIANCSGFYGDRLSAAREMVEGGPIDVLTGDWLAELTMLILAGNQLKGRPGYAPTFLAQLEQVLATCLDRGIRIVSNAGGLDPAGCAAAVGELAGRLGLRPRIAHVTGDDLSGRPEVLGEMVNADTGERLDAAPLTANAYLGARPVAVALERGADVVITGRITDAALVVGPGMWRYGWAGDLDAIAGAIVAGHVIECGCQATGGNYAFFQEVPDAARCGFPIAELHEDGSAVITKHPGTGGMVSVGTVTAQLLYEIGGPRYVNPDAVARFDTIRLAQEGPDRVRISGVRGEPPPDTLKVALNLPGGYRNTMTLVLTGLDIPAKARLAEEAVWSRVPRDSFERVHVELTPLTGEPEAAAGPGDPTGAGEPADPAGAGEPADPAGAGEPADPAGAGEPADPVGPGDALPRALLRITVMDADRRRAGRAFSSAVVETGLASYPGFFGLTPPGDASPYGVYWPVLVPASAVRPVVHLDGTEIPVPPTLPGPDVPGQVPDPSSAAEPSRPFDTAQITDAPPREPTRRLPLGVLAGARSGDKGGDANLGVWVRTAEQYAWLRAYLTVDRLKHLLPRTRELEVTRHDLPNLRALNFVVHGLLGRGVAANPGLDAQAKALGEELRARPVDIPSGLLPD
jgi:hypothetical protein